MRALKIKMKSTTIWWRMTWLMAGLVLFLVGMAGGIAISQRGDVGETAVSPTSPPASEWAILPSPSPSPPLLSSPTALIANPTISATSTPLSTATITPTLTPTPTSSATPTPWFERRIIGYSVEERPIELVRLGHGERWFVLLGALHGGHECNTSGVVEGIIEYFKTEPAQLPADVTLFAIPLINQDGCAANTRNNANGVDLNRNWDTPDWQANAQAAVGLVVGAGGPQPFSEPETQLLRDWLLALQAAAGRPLVVISYHSTVPQTGLVQPGYYQPGEPGYQSEQLALRYSEITGYRYSETWVGNYTITGELVYWANLQGIVAIDVELPDRGAADTVPTGWSETHIQTNLRGVLGLVRLGEEVP